MSIDAGTHGNGKIIVDSKAVTDQKTNDADSSFSLNINANLGEDLVGIAGNLTAKLGLKSLVKDYQLYLQLSEFDLQASEALQANVGFLGAMVEGFKQKWFSINHPELKMLMQQGQSPFLDLSNPDLFKEKPEYYTDPVKTTYEGQPAWKVGLDIELVKKDVQTVIAQLQQEILSGVVDEASREVAQAEFQQEQEALKATFEQLKIENLEAYFVIYAKDKVNFVIKNVDISIDTVNLNIKQLSTAKTQEGTIVVSPVETSEQLTLTYKLTETGKGRYAFTAEFALPGEKQKLLVDGKVAFAADTKGFSIKPDFKVTFDAFVVTVQGEYALNTLDTYTFTAPESAQDLNEVLGGFLGMGELSDEELSDEALMDEDALEVSEHMVIDASGTQLSTSQLQ